MKHSIFAIELCLRLERRSVLRADLRQLVTSHPASTSPERKANLLREISGLLLENQNLFEMGCWDFFDSDDRALADYDMWCKGMTTEEGARPQPSGAPGERDDEPRFMTFTIALLLVAGSSCEKYIAALCATPKDQLWKKATFLKILKGLDRVDFAGVKSDVLYLIPGEEDWGLTAGDLKHPKFEYLRTIA